jgi:transposase
VRRHSVFIGNAERRFGSGKQVARYLGLVPLEQSRGETGGASGTLQKGEYDSGFLLVEATQGRVRSCQNGTASISTVGLRVKTWRGSGCDRLLPLVPVAQCRKKKDGRPAG